MGWAIEEACGSKECSRATPTNYLEILLPSGNKEANIQIDKFIEYLDQIAKKTSRNVRYANITNIQIRYFNRSGKMKTLYKGSDLNEDEYDNIISKIK